MTLKDYEGMDNSRKDFHEWLKTRVNLVKNSTEISDKRVFALTEALMTEIDFLSNDLSERTKKLFGRIDFLEKYVQILGNAVVFIGEKLNRSSLFKRK